MLPTFLAHLFLWRLERNVEFKIRRKPIFSWIPGSIYLKDASCEFEDYLAASSGQAIIRYPLNILFRSEFPVSFDAARLSVWPRARLEKTLGGQQVLFDKVSAKLIIRPGKTMQIEFLEAQSKTVEFHLGARK